MSFAPYWRGSQKSRGQSKKDADIPLPLAPAEREALLRLLDRTIADPLHPQNRHHLEAIRDRLREVKP